MEHQESTPISTYHEHIFGVIDRRFTLYADRILIAGTIRGVRSENNVMLTDLKSPPNRIWLRSKHFHWSLAAIAIASSLLILPFLVTPPAYSLLYFELYFGFAVAVALVL